MGECGVKRVRGVASRCGMERLSETRLSGQVSQRICISQIHLRPEQTGRNRP